MVCFTLLLIIIYYYLQLSCLAGLLGVVPWDKPSVYAQLNVQCAVLSVYLAAVAQQVTDITLCS